MTPGSAPAPAHETVRIVTPLGVRFWDALLDQPVTGGLVVTATPLTGHGRPVVGVTTPSGVIAFHGLPGLRRAERPPSGADGGEAAVTFVLEVADRRRRFLPTVLLVAAPHTGLAPMLPAPGSLPVALPGEESPPSGTPVIYLFASPDRRTLGDVAVVRASLATRSGAAAAHAVVLVTVGGVRWAGVSDRSGNVAVMLPLPVFAGAAETSPPVGAEGVPPDDQSWPSIVTVHHEPDRLDRPRGETPTLASIFSQESTAIRPSTDGPAVPELTPHLRYGRELVLRTAGSPTSALTVGT